MSICITSIVSFSYRMLTDDPTLLSATEYHNTVEHLSLSQSQGQSQQSEGMDGKMDRWTKENKKK